MYRGYEYVGPAVGKITTGSVVKAQSGTVALARRVASEVGVAYLFVSGRDGVMREVDVRYVLDR